MKLVLTFDIKLLSTKQLIKYFQNVYKKEYSNFDTKTKWTKNRIRLFIF